MRVFISWSGARSRRIAEGLRDWLPMLFPTLDPWVSSADIRAGSRWAREIGDLLEQSQFGILCLTQRNIVSPWILFEAGALSKSLAEGRVIPYLVDLRPDELSGPLAQFQAATADAEGTRRLITSIAEVLGPGNRSAEQLWRLFDRLWPEFRQHIELAEGIPDLARNEEGESDVSELAARLQYAVTRALDVPAEELDKAGDLLSQADAGVVKLIGQPGVLEGAGVRGGGSYYDFIRRDQQYGYGSDVGLMASSRLGSPARTMASSFDLAECLSPKFCMPA